MIKLVEGTIFYSKRTQNDDFEWKIGLYLKLLFRKRVDISIFNTYLMGSTNFFCPILTFLPLFSLNAKISY